MLQGQLVSLRARRLEDIPVLQDELRDDVPTRSRADGRPWRPISQGSNVSPYAVREPDEEVAAFSVVELASQDLVGEASLWKIDTHNRSAPVGLAFRPAMRRRGYGADVVNVLCHYAFATLGLHRLQLETLIDNHAMIRIAERVGFSREGALHQSVWVTGRFVDEIVFGLVSADRSTT